MNTRRITVFLVLGMAAALFLTHKPVPRRLLAPVIGGPAAAQSPDANLIVIKSVPNTVSTPDDLWQHFDVTVPPANPPLDMHVVFLVDGKGTDYITEQSMPWPQKMPLKLRVDQDDDKRVKAILKAQNLPVNSRLVTYHFSYRSNGSGDSDQTLTFLHSSAGSGEIQGAGQASAEVGSKVMLYQSIIYDDSAFKSSLYRPFANWHPEGYAKSLPAGFSHRLSVYLQFQPHTGFLIKNAVIFDRKPVQFPANFDITKM